MSNATVVVFDIDGVLCDLTGRLLAAWNDRNPGQPLTEPTAWCVADAYPDLNAWERDWWKKAYANPYYYATAWPIPGALAAVLTARSLGYAVRFRSSRPPALQATTRTWLEEHRFLSPHDPDDYVVCGPKAKRDALHLAAGQLVFVDDSDQQLSELFVLEKRHARPTQYWLIDRPHNHGNTSFRRMAIGAVGDFLLRLANANRGVR